MLPALILKALESRRELWWISLRASGILGHLLVKIIEWSKERSWDGQLNKVLRD